MHCSAIRLSKDHDEKWKISCKHMSKLKFFWYMRVLYIKRKLRACTIKLKKKKYDFLKKNFFLTISTSKGPPFGKKSKILKKKIFLGNNHTFSLWICIVHVLSFLLMYITLMYQKILNFDIFLHENFHFLPWSFDSWIGQNYS